MLKQLKETAKRLKREIVPIYYAMLDKRTPAIAKVLTAVALSYLLSPIDLIPDFIPVLGIIDDIILIPILIRIIIKLIPSAVLNDIKVKYNMDIKLHKKWYFALPIVAIYLYILFLIYRYFQQ